MMPSWPRLDEIDVRLRGWHRHPRALDRLRALPHRRAGSTLHHIVLRVIRIGANAPVLPIDLPVERRVELLEVDAELLVVLERLVGPRDLLVRVEQNLQMMMLMMMMMILYE